MVHVGGVQCEGVVSGASDVGVVAFESCSGFKVDLLFLTA